MTANIDIELTDDRALLNGEDVTQAIRSFEVTTLTQHAADNRAVRKHLIRLQQAFARDRDIVTEGRDQATVVFPNAELKIYLTASDQVRALRRFDDLTARGEQVSLAEVLAKQTQRDQRDLEREFGGLCKAEDSIEICTDHLTPDQVVSTLEKLVAQARG
jgi:cytidylate kinase